MMNRSSVALWAGLSICGLVPSAMAQFVPIDQERSVLTASELGNGTSDGDFDMAANFGPFSPSLTTSVTATDGAYAHSFASQNTEIGSSLIVGSLGSGADVNTGSSFVTGQGSGRSSYLLLFSVAADTPVEFFAHGTINLTGVNPNGEPSDLYGRASVRLFNSGTDELVAGFMLFPQAGSDSASFAGILPAGSYALLANAETFAFSPDLLGPPLRSGLGNSQVTFSLAIPAPASFALLGMGGLLAARRRR